MTTAETRKKNLGIYMHIPFCRSKCRYCDFLSFPTAESDIDTYMAALKNEIHIVSPLYKNFQIDSLFIGGGTPSVLFFEQLEPVITALYQHFDILPDAEVTIEANPGTLDSRKLSGYRSLGINRLSLGLQSIFDETLRYLGRIHTYAQFKENYQAARKAGFQNINIDLMSALPGQTIKDWEQTLQEILALEPEHISAYSLIIEEGTPFHALYENNTQPLSESHQDTDQSILPLPKEEQDRQMYTITKELLQKHNYHRYEFSNYAKPSHSCRHNIRYWTRKNYLGLGLGAASMVNNIRFQNESSLPIYQKRYQSILTSPTPANYATHHPLTRKEQIEETLFLGLRLTEGIDLKTFQSTFQTPLLEIYPQIIPNHIKNGLLHLNKTTEKLHLTEKGVSLSNQVLADFLLD